MWVTAKDSLEGEREREWREGEYLFRINLARSSDVVKYTV